MLHQLQHPNINGYINGSVSKLHTKIVLIDGDEALLGAHNWTYSSINNSYEVSLWIRSDQPLTDLNQKFEGLRSSAVPYEKLRKASKR